MGWRWAGVWVVAVGLHAGPAVADPVWPLDSPPVLTSSFGEPRRTHLHAGIDLGTEGRTGIACRAVDEGWIARLRMSPFGYGKAVYLQLDSGALVVYAHLERFAEPMAARAWQEQVRRGQYTFDVHLERGEIRVRRGEIVAWSGDTGVGSPHLHFEVRDGDVATNPQTRGFALEDRVPPMIRAVEILPLDAQAHVEGRGEPLILTDGAGRAPLRAAGRLGFAVRAIDRAAIGASVQVPYRYEARIDGRLLFRAVHERFDYADNHHIVLDYDQEQLHSQDTRFFLLFARATSRLPGREAGAAAGGGQVIAGIPEAEGLDDPSLLAPGAHELEVEVADVGGLTQRWRVPFLASHRPRLERMRATRAADSVTVEIAASDADGDSLTLQLQVSRDKGKTWTALRARDAGGRHHWVARDATVGALVFRARVRDVSGLEAFATCAPESATNPARLPLRVTTDWRYGRLEIALVADAVLAGPPRLLLHRAGTQARTVALGRQIDARRFDWVLDLNDLDDLDALEVEASACDGRRAILHVELPARIVRRGRARRIDDLHPRLWLEFESRTVLEPIALRMHDADPAALGLGTELRPAGLCVQVEPRTAALDEHVRIRVIADDAPGGSQRAAPPPAHLGLFVFERGQLRFVSAERNAQGELVGETRSLGTFVVLQDETPPVLRDFRAVPRRGAAPRLQFVAHDAGADLGDAGIRVHIDDEVAIPEWDPETGRVLVHPTLPLGRGVHLLHAEAEDRLGNRSQRRFEFTVP